VEDDDLAAPRFLEAVRERFAITRSLVDPRQP